MRICIYHFLLKHMISTYSGITGCNFDLLPLFSLSSGGERGAGGVGMCFVGKREGECQGQQQEGQQQESAQQRKGLGGGVWVFASLDAIECVYCIVSCAVTSLDGGGGEPLVPGGGHKNFSLSYSYIISSL